MKSRNLPFSMPKPWVVDDVVHEFVFEVGVDGVRGDVVRIGHAGFGAGPDLAFLSGGPLAEAVPERVFNWRDEFVVAVAVFSEFASGDGDDVEAVAWQSDAAGFFEDFVDGVEVVHASTLREMPKR